MNGIPEGHRTCCVCRRDRPLAKMDGHRCADRVRCRLAAARSWNAATERLRVAGEATNRRRAT